jgi:hypothetical protein
MRPYPHEFDTRIYNQVKGKENLTGIVLSMGMIRDSIAPFVDYNIKAFPCENDSIFVLKKNPLR